MRVVKRALVNNRNYENEIKKVSSNPHLLIATEISELRPVSPYYLACATAKREAVIKESFRTGYRGWNSISSPR